MATYRDAALAAYNGRHADWIKAAQQRLVPLMTDKTGAKVLDPFGKTAVAHEDADAGLVILRTTDGSNVSFAVYPDHPERPVAVVELLDGEWTRRGDVADLDDVGAVLAELEAAK